MRAIVAVCIALFALGGCGSVSWVEKPTALDCELTGKALQVLAADAHGASHPVFDVGVPPHLASAGLVGASIRTTRMPSLNLRECAARTGWLPPGIQLVTRTGADVPYANGCRATWVSRPDVAGDRASVYVRICQGGELRKWSPRDVIEVSRDSAGRWSATGRADTQ